MGLAIGANWLLPMVLTGTGAGAPGTEAPPEPVAPVEAPVIAAPPAFEDIQFQVQVRQRVMIRITPLSRVSPPPATTPRDDAPRRPARAADDTPRQCIPLAEVAGVKLGEGRTLLLYMRNRRVISTLLERSCQVSNFYSGFYVERPADGMLCAGREALHARSGADCQLSAFREVGD